MSVTVFFPILAGPAIFVLGGLALSRGRSERARRLFFALCALLGAWSIALFEQLQSGSLAQATFWSKVQFAWPVAFAVMLHFAWLVAESPDRRAGRSTARASILVITAIYAPAALIALLDLATDLVRTIPAESAEAWSFGLRPTIAGIVAVAWVAAGGCVALALLANRFYRAAGSRARRLMLLTAIGVGTGWAGFLAIAVLLPALGVQRPELFGPLFLAQIIVVKAALRWYGASIVPLSSSAPGEDRLLVREIHHRVKNSLAMISSLIDLHQLDSQNGNGHLLEELKARLHSIALVHEKLYRGDAKSVEFGEYARELLDNVVSSFKPEGTNVDLCVNIELLRLPIDVAVPLGLILTELSTNAVKYGFGEGRSVRLRLEMRCARSQCRLTFSNSGTTMPLDVDAENGSLGLRLVWALVDQLSGSIELVREPETRFVITFPAEE